MVVDDDETTLQVLSAALEERGHHVIQRKQSIGTTLALARESIDVVLLDVRMPGITGGRLAELIASQIASAPIVILHSSMSRPELEQLTQKSNATGFIEKTGDIGTFLRRFEQTVAMARHASAKQPPSGRTAGRT